MNPNKNIIVMTTPRPVEHSDFNYLNAKPIVALGMVAGTGKIGPTHEDKIVSLQNSLMEQSCRGTRCLYNFQWKELRAIGLTDKYYYVGTADCYGDRYEKGI